MLSDKFINRALQLFIRFLKEEEIIEVFKKNYLMYLKQHNKQRYVKYNNAYICWKEKVVKMNRIEPSFNVIGWFNTLNDARNENNKRNETINRNFVLEEFEFTVMAKIPRINFFARLKKEDEILYNIKDKWYTILNILKKDTKSSSDS